MLADFPLLIDSAELMPAGDAFEWTSRPEVEGAFLRQRFRAGIRAHWRGGIGFLDDSFSLLSDETL
jgi:hypothetical protein